jgi:hypothetical protein
MPAVDPRIDAYIARSPGFATGILTRLRALVHQGCPEVVETMKWRRPFFEHAGPLCFMAAFKQHCAFGFWRRRGRGEAGAMGNYGRITAIAGLPPRREVLAAIRAAAARNQEQRKAGGRARTRPGAQGPRSRPVRAGKAQAAPLAPADLTRALARARDASREFAAFSLGKQRDYISWLEEAKRPETRAKRLATAIGWIAEGKERNWKYIR